MADTRVQKEVEDWVRSTWMHDRYSMNFERRKLNLSSGGEYSFDAVSMDERFVATISTSRARTSSGKLGAGKLFKIRSDMYFLLLAKTDRRVVLLTENDMFDLLEREREKGRVPDSIEFSLVALPEELSDRLDESRITASREVTPS